MTSSSHLAIDDGPQSKPRQNRTAEDESTRDKYRSNQKNTSHQQQQQTTDGQKEEPRQGQEEEEKEEDDTYKASSSVPKSLILSSLFESQKEKTKSSFLMAIDMFIINDKIRRGHVEFIYSALKNMKEFGVHRDLETYKQIFNVFPKGKFIPTNIFQVEFMHFPKQQQCAITLLDQMEEFGVQPDGEFQSLIELTFGRRTHPMRKFQRMLYWMPKFKNLSPWPLPDPLPDSSLELAKLAMQRITSTDLQTKITCFNVSILKSKQSYTFS